MTNYKVDFSRSLIGEHKITPAMLDEKGFKLFGDFFQGDDLSISLTLNNFCDLRCVYCNPLASSKWERELELWYKRDLSPKKIELPESDSRFTDYFWQWMEQDGSARVTLWEMSGGEPLVHPNFSTTVLKICELGKKNGGKERSTFRILTNLNSPERIVDKLEKEILPVITETFQVELLASLEGVGKRIEYSRYGLSWETFKLNAERLAALKFKNYSFGFQVTLNALSISGLSDFLKFAKFLHDKSNRAIILKLGILTENELLQPKILTPEFNEYFDEALFFLHEVKDKMKRETETVGSWPYFHDQLKQIQSEMKLVFTGHPQERARFYKFITEYDLRRGCNFLQNFPEYTRFYKECRKEHLKLWAAT